ncbi:MAG: response regulator [Methylophagaceae bacterium]
MKILVIDDHTLYLEGIRAVLNQYLPSADIITTTTISDIKNLISLHHDIDLILLDLRMPNGGAPAVLSDLREEKVLVPIIIVSASESSTDVQLVMDKGAAGYLPKTTSPSELINAIETVLAGDIYLPAKWQTRLSGKNPPIVVDNGIEEIILSARLHDVLQLIEKGYTTKEISKLLKLSENTIYGYVKDLFSKFNVSSRTELIQTAKQLNLFGFK